MSRAKGQSIGCSVKSCCYNDEYVCGLESIQVCPCAHANNGSPEDESMCGSYRSRGG